MREFAPYHWAQGIADYVCIAVSNHENITPQIEKRVHASSRIQPFFER